MASRALVILLWIPITAFAEVTDKVQSYPSMWFSALLLAALLGGLSYLKPLFLIPAVGISLFLAYGYYDMESDHVFRQVVLNEMGESYFIFGYLSSFTTLTAALFGAFCSRLHSKHEV
ncbi:hypothetical protein [Marinobacter sp.]|uniref:hypothetical protein n=1 Tax=Marinobacter sp. TaxID=50741 RepID=UPI003A9312EB